jgi:hypothetical protein
MPSSLIADSVARGGSAAAGQLGNGSCGPTRLFMRFAPRCSSPTSPSRKRLPWRASRALGM